MRSDAKASSAGSTSSKGQPRLLISLCLALAGLLAFCAAPALAAQTHPYTGISFGPDGVGGSQSFEGVRSIAVDPVNGDVYVYDAGAGSIYKFDSAGAPKNFTSTASNVIGVGGYAGGAEFEIALAPAGAPGGTAGDIYVANNGQAVHVYSAAGAALGEVEQGGETCGVATDPAGNFYAGVYGSTVNKYSPNANPPTTANKEVGTIEQGICNVAADGLGNVYAANFDGRGLFKLEGIADATPVQVASGADTMAVAPGTDNLYANRRNEVAVYDSTGTQLGAFASGEISESRGVAANNGETKIYVSDSQKVRVYGPSAIVPDATTEAASGISKASTTLNGTVGAAGGPDATCVFQYATEQQYFEHGFQGATEKPCSPAGPFTGSGTTAVTATATALVTETTYYFRLIGSNENGSYNGQALSFTAPGAVNVATTAASAVADDTATVNGTVNPEGTELEECGFEYGKTGSYGTTVPCAESPATIGSGNSPVAVHADLSGLSGGTNYHFRLAGTNEFGSSVGADASFKTQGPSIESEALTGVSLSSAIFKAQINPNGEATSYVFEYVSEADFNASGFANATQLPAGGETIGAGTTGVEVEQEATGLTPRATYHVRVVATNAGGAVMGPKLVFSTFSTSAQGLPDGRVYEQATAVDKDGGGAQGFKNNVQASPSGNGISFFVNGGLPESEGAQDLSPFVAMRSAGSWATQGLLPAAKLGSVAYFKGLSNDFSVSYSSAGFTYRQAVLYAKDTASKQYSPLADIPEWGGTGAYHGTSADSDQMLFEDRVALTPGAAEEEAPNVYVSDRPTQQVLLAGVLNDGQAPAAGTVAGPWDYFNGGGGDTKYYTQEEHAISADGSKVFFSDVGGHQLYMRANPTQPQSAMSGGACTEAAKACTYQVSKSQRSTPDPAGPQPAKFVTATADGSKVFFMSEEELTDDANTGAADDSNNLYSYDTNTHVITDLTPSSLAENPHGAEVSGILGISDDGSRVYFGAGGVFAPGATAGGPCTDVNRQPGICNVYQWHAGDVTYVTQMDSGPDATARWMSQNWAPGDSGTGSPRTSRVSADGRTLIFASPNNLTDYDSKGFDEYYRYHEGDSKLLCLTCLPSGEDPRGPATLQSIQAGLLAPTYGNAFNTRNLAPSGDRFFFESVDRLLGADTNGVKDVYEWEADGTGSCSSDDQNGGCLYLISTGTSPLPSYFADAGESGDDAFIFTAQPLVGQDLDQLVDIYDARVGGGLAYQNPPPPSICVGEACRPGTTPAPPSQSAGTSSFSGPGNPQPSKQGHKKKKHHQKKHRKKHRSKKHQHKSVNRQQGSNR